jgi:hypothetical protein
MKRSRLNPGIPNTLSQQQVFSPCHLLGVSRQSRGAPNMGNSPIWTLIRCACEPSKDDAMLAGN